jgi:hypothetical protein
LDETLAAKILQIEALVGRISSGQHPLLAAALDQDELGVYALAKRLATSGARNPAAVFITNLRAGEHRRGPENDSRAPRRDWQNPVLQSSPAERERFNLIAREWQLIQENFARAPVSTLWPDLKATCRDPNNPTNREAETVRKTLIFALAEAGIT